MGLKYLTVKLFNDIENRIRLTGTIVLLLAGMLLLNACATLQHERLIPPPLQTDSPAVQVDDVDLLAVSPAMDEFLERYILIYPNKQTRLELLTSAVTSYGVLGFKYDEAFTLSASEAFDTRAGNCIGFSNMMVALARRERV